MKNSVKIARLFLLILILFLFSCENKKKEINKKDILNISNTDTYQDYLRKVITISKDIVTKTDVSLGEERKRFINNALENISFLEVVKKNSQGELEALNLEEYLSNIQLVLCTSNELSSYVSMPKSSHFDLGLFIFIFVRKEYKEKGKNIYRIFANKEKMKIYEKEYLALCLLHELNHVYQFLMIPSMKLSKDRENDSWTFQVSLWKSGMSEEQKKLYKKKLKEQRKKKFSSTSFFEENDSWITQTFGSPLGYVDMFIFDCYGYEAIKDFY